MSGEAVDKPEKWSDVVKFMIDLLDALVKSIEAWRELLVKYNATTLEVVRDVRKLREAISEAPSEVKFALLDARLALEEVMSVLAGGAEKLLDEDEFKQVVNPLKEARERLARALEAGGGGEA